ncbi:MAG TPA: cyclase [Dehalococcoidia bacterium]|nr:cyclase [Dehalococcoidia bacterium]
MASTIFVRHRVADYEAWKKGYDAAEPLRKQYGVTRKTVHRDPDDPNLIIVSHRFPDIAQARAFSGAAELREVMQQAGVQGQPEFWFTEDIEEIG